MTQTAPAQAKIPTEFPTTAPARRRAAGRPKKASSPARAIVLAGAPDAPQPEVAAR